MRFPFGSSAPKTAGEGSPAVEEQAEIKRLQKDNRELTADHQKLLKLTQKLKARNEKLLGEQEALKAANKELRALIQEKTKV